MEIFGQIVMLLAGCGVFMLGFKLLSEIRIGSTGIDYLGVAKDKIALIQLDTTEGNWFASEDKVEGNNAPVWFSELGNKTSPVSRAIEARNNISELIKGEIDLPIETNTYFVKKAEEELSKILKR